MNCSSPRPSWDIFFYRVFNKRKLFKSVLLIVFPSLLFILWILFCCCCPVTHSFLTLCSPMNCNMPGFPVLHHLPELAQTHVHGIDDAIHLFLCHPLLLLPSIFPRIKVFSNELVLSIRWPKYWSFSFSISPSNVYSGWFYLELTGLISLQSKGLSSIFSSTTLRKHQFFSAQPSLWSNYWKHQVGLPINARSGKGELEELGSVKPELHSLGNSEVTYLSLLVPLHVY